MKRLSSALLLAGVIGWLLVMMFSAVFAAVLWAIVMWIAVMFDCLARTARGAGRGRAT